jgi:hypothetical protein
MVYMVTEQLLSCQSVIREYRADNMQLQQADLLDSGETLHQLLFLRSFLEQADVCLIGLSQ